MSGGSPGATNLALGERLEPADLVDRLRLIRTQGIEPIAFRQLLLRFGSTEAALAAIPDLARRGGGKVPAVFARDKAEQEIEAAEKLGARYLSLGQGLYPRALAELEDAPPLLTTKGKIVRLSGAEPGAVQLVLLELDLAGRLDRQAGNKVSLR